MLKRLDHCLFITEIVLVVSYILAMILARRQNKQDVEKVRSLSIYHRDCYCCLLYISYDLGKETG